MCDVPRRERARRVDDLLATMNLTEVPTNRPAKYSGGTVGRLELAQALINRPGPLILDEPTVGVDSIARDDVWTQVQ